LNFFRRARGQHDFGNAVIPAEKRGRLDGRLDGLLEDKLEDAKNMLAIGMSADQIVQVTGLTRKQIESLRIGG
jgi:predicted transposase/invertase (TIGR01784 family)